MSKYIFIFLILLATTISARASSAFFLKSPTKAFVVKDFRSNNGVGYLIVNPRGERMTALSARVPFMSWESRYGSITFNQLSKNMPIGGVNEKGLVVEMMRSNEMSAQVKKSDINLNEFETVRYLLDNCENTFEAVEAIKKINVKIFSEKVHYLIADKNAKTAIVEYINGEVVVIDDSSGNYVPILTNNSFSKSLESARGAKAKNNRGDQKFTYIYKCIDTLSNISVGKMFDVMRNSREADSKWNVVYDMVDQKIYFNSLSSPVVKEIDIALIDFESDTQMYIDINMLLATKCNSELAPITPQSHLMLVMNGFETSSILYFDNEAKEYLANGDNFKLQEVMSRRGAKLGTLKITIDNLDSDRGVVRVFLYDSEKDFNERNFIRSVAVHVKNEMASAYFYNLPKDKNYAIYYYHDENTNNHTDRQWVGLPKEAFGYSGRNGRSFNNAKFEFGNLGVMHYQIELSSFLFW